MILMYVLFHSQREIFTKLDFFCCFYCKYLDLFAVIVLQNARYR